MPKPFLRLLVIAGCVLALLPESSPAAGSATDGVPRIEAVRVERAPLVDGRLIEPAWEEATPISDLRQVRPVDGAPVSEPTEIRVVYDKDALYIGARLVDRRGPEAITANNMRQGSRLPDDDRIAIILDPSGAGRGAYRFEVNLNGVRNDMLYQNGELRGEWDVVWQAAAQLTEEGWSAEIAIPFKTLPADPNVESWGFNVSRAIRGKAEEAVWVSRNRTWGPSITGRLGGIRDVDQGVGLDIVPTLGVQDLRFAGATPDRRDVNPSLDVYYRVTPSLSASITLNTDFSGTDVDTRQVNLTRFSLFFPEKRDFFLKDADLFDFGRIPANGRPFFSRKIGLSPLGTPIDIDYGGKVSGRIGRWRVGLLGVRQDEFAPVVGPQLRPSTLGVARIAVDVLEESSLGFIGTTGDPFSDASSSLLGADFLYLNSRFAGNRTLEGEAWIQQTRTPGLAGEDLALGGGLRLLDRAGWEFGADVQHLGRNFRPALGFVSRPGTRQYSAFSWYNRQVEGERVQRISHGIDAKRVESVDGPLESQEITLLPLEFETRGRDVLQLSYTLLEERLSEPFTIYSDVNGSVVIPPGAYSFGEAGLTFTGGQQRRVATRLVLRRGSFYDGDKLTVGTEANWKVSKYLSLRAGYEFNDIDLPGGDFTTRILVAGFNVNFSSQLTWTNLLQYDNVSEIAGIQSHLHYIPKAGQKLILVFNYSAQDLDRDSHFRFLASELGARLNYTFRF